MEYFSDNFRITTDKGQMNIDTIHQLLVKTYWAATRSKSTQEACMRSSLCYGLFDGDEQIGFARVISDYATFAYLCDVVIAEPYRGRGLAKWMMSCILEHPQLQGMRRWLLSTRDAHEFYAKFGFAPLSKPEKFMEIYRPAEQDTSSPPDD